MSPLLSSGGHIQSVSSMLEIVGKELKVFGRFRDLDVPIITDFLKEHEGKNVVFERMTHERLVYLQSEGESVERIEIRPGTKIFVKAERHLYTE